MTNIFFDFLPLCIPLWYSSNPTEAEEYCILKDMMDFWIDLQLIVVPGI